LPNDKSGWLSAGVLSSLGLLGFQKKLELNLQHFSATRKQGPAFMTNNKQENVDQSLLCDTFSSPGLQGKEM
jgi:hypothetical protein